MAGSEGILEVFDEEVERMVNIISSLTISHHHVRRVPLQNLHGKDVEKIKVYFLENEETMKCIIHSSFQSKNDQVSLLQNTASPVPLLRHSPTIGLPIYW